MKPLSILYCTSALVFAAPAAAQDVAAPASSGNVVLTAGFEPDPRIGQVTSGGPNDIAKSVPGCEGFVSEAALVRLSYTPEPGPAALPLFIHAYSKGDTMLLVNAPDGNWYCNDDGFNDQNPMLIFAPAMAGDYEIWVGSFRRGESHPAILAFSEVGANVDGFEAELSRLNGR